MMWFPRSLMLPMRCTPSRKVHMSGSQQQKPASSGAMDGLQEEW